MIVCAVMTTGGDDGGDAGTGANEPCLSSPGKLVVRSNCPGAGGSKRISVSWCPGEVDVYDEANASKLDDDWERWSDCERSPGGDEPGHSDTDFLSSCGIGIGQGYDVCGSDR